jgi:hypothetical protein
MKSPIRSSFFGVEGRVPQVLSNLVIFRTKLFCREVPVHPMKKALSYMLVVACLFLVAAGSLWAKRQEQEKENQPASSSTAATPLDYDYFKTKVEPIFLFKRPGHARCIVCHTINHVPLHLVPLSPGSTTWNEEQSRQNFELVQRVVVPGSMESPLLRHPLAQQAGGDPAHGGGKHFESQDNPEWLTLKAWVFGATMK